MFKEELNKEQFLRLIDKVCAKIDNPKIRIKEKGSTVLFGKNTYPSNKITPHDTRPNLKSELLKNENTIKYLCNIPGNKTEFKTWCIREERKEKDSSFFSYEENITITDKINALLKLDCVKSPTHLEFIFRTFNGERLYKYLNDLKKGNNHSIEEKYIFALTNFLGFSNFEKFDIAHPEEIVSTNSSRDKINLSHDENFTEFTGHYYDFEDAEIKDFYLAIDFTIKKDQLDLDTKFPNAKQAGLHHTNRKLQFEGNAYELNSKWHVILWIKDTTRGDKEKIKIILVGGNKAIQESRILKGLILATNSKMNPVSVEAVFTRKDKTYSNSERLRLERYLMIWRNNIILLNKTFSLNDLTAKNIEIDNLSCLIGVWHVIRYDENWNLIHSLLHIENNYRIKCYLFKRVGNQYKLDSQDCHINPSLNINTILYLQCSPEKAKQKNSIASHLALSIPHFDTTIVSGTMIFDIKNSDQKILPVMRSIVIQKVNKEIATFLAEGDRFNKKNAREFLKPTLEQNRELWILKYPYLLGSLNALKEMNLANKIDDSI